MDTARISLIKFAFILFFFAVASLVEAQPLKNVVLRKSAAVVRDDQVKTLKILDGALERLRAQYKPSRTALSTEYEDWKEIYNGFAGHVDDADKHIADLEANAGDLFTEWAQEAETITDSNLKSRSMSKLEDTKYEYAKIHQQLVEKREGAQKIIVQMRDRVLFIKHSLNAESLDVLRDEASDIETDIESLRIDMEDSLTKLNTFIGTLP